MNMISFLPMVGGLFALAIAIWFTVKKDLKEESRRYFFFSMICLAVFGIFESLAYLTNDAGTALPLLVISKEGGFVFPFFIMSFSLYLRGKSELHKWLALPTMIMALIAASTVESIHSTSWGWSVTFDKAVWGPLYLYSLALLFIGLRELFILLREMKKDKNPHHKKLAYIAYGFLGWTLLAISTNIIVNYFELEILSPLSFLQIFPCAIVVWGFVGKDGN